MTLLSLNAQWPQRFAQLRDRAGLRLNASLLRALAFVAVLAILASVLISDLIDVLERRRTADVIAERLAHAQTLPAAQPAAGLALPPGETRFVGADRALALADMQRKLAQIADENSVRIVSIGPVEGADRDNLRLDAELDVPDHALLAFLHAIETAVPFLFVERLTLSQGSAAPAETGRRHAVVLRLEAAHKEVQP